MKKFTNSNIVEKKFTSKDVLKNELYDLIEETLSPNIENIDKSKLTISGKEDLVGDLMKIVENSNIETTIEYLQTLKAERNDLKVEEKKDPLMEAFDDVDFNDNVLEAINPYQDDEYKNKIDNIFKEYEKLEIKYKQYNDDENLAQLEVKTVWNNDNLAVYVSSTPLILSIKAYKEGTGQGLDFYSDIKINDEVYQDIIMLLKDITQYVNWDNNYEIESIKTLDENIY